MDRRMTLILGGARSGKSAYAQKIAEANATTVLYIATATASDSEMAARIAAHRASRPTHWQTLEAPRQIGVALRSTSQNAQIILLDCVTLLVNNILMELPESSAESEAQAAVDTEISELLSTYEQTTTHWIIVSNEVGLGLVPPYPLGRLYRDLLGRTNQRLAQIADQVVLMVAGLPLIIKQ
jgi:adenosylcobinamide kinase/adenosylcobinamide-phosphate guanylyltransferase